MRLVGDAMGVYDLGTRMHLAGSHFWQSKSDETPFCSLPIKKATICVQFINSHVATGSV